MLYGVFCKLCSSCVLTCLCALSVNSCVVLYGFVFVFACGGDVCIMVMCLCVVCELLCDVVWIVVV